MPNEVQAEFNKFNSIGRKDGTGMLRNATSIEVEIFKDGKLHLITWNSSSHSLQEWNDSTGTWKAANTVSNIKELFPIQIFSQKDLYALTGNPSKLIEFIVGFSITLIVKILFSSEIFADLKNVDFFIFCNAEFN